MKSMFRWTIVTLVAMVLITMATSFCLFLWQLNGLIIYYLFITLATMGLLPWQQRVFLSNKGFP